MHTLYTVGKKMDLHNFYYVCHIFTPQCLNICEIFARSKFVQIHFFVRCYIFDVTLDGKHTVNPLLSPTLK